MTKSTIINKFGGGILTKDLIPLIKNQLKNQLINGYRPIIVLSAMPGITDLILEFINELKECHNINLIKKFILKLIDKHEQILIDIELPLKIKKEVMKEIKSNLCKIEKEIIKQKNISPALEDKITSYGERLSAIIITYYLNYFDLESEIIKAEDIPIITDNNFKNANINWRISEKNINTKISGINKIVVIPGFTGKTQKGEITTLGRGGTDTTACFVGAALKSKKVILWKNVGGVLSTDPKIIKEAKTVPFINYFEAEEAGKIIHDKAIQYIKINKTPIEITSLIQPKVKTRIGEIKKMEKGAKIVNLKKDLDFVLITDEKIKLNDLIILVSNIFNKYKIDIILISNTGYSLQLIIENKNNKLEKACNELSDLVENIEITKANMIFLVGWFEAKDVSNFNDLLLKEKNKLLISAFYYEKCYRMEAIIKTDNLNKTVEAVYKKFIK